MKPIKLTMQAFGPFADKCVIDFEGLYSDGVYLITGDTGSGKTTIFDAITYALFGGASGEYRSNNSFRSKYCADTTETYVSLEFLHDENTYVVTRNPEYIRPPKNSKNSGRWITQKASAKLEFADGRSIEGISEVNKKINEIVGLDVNQFRQTSMLAQGDFQKLLFASTKERQEIFRKIFNTENYEELQRRIRDKSNAISRRLDGLKEKISMYLSTVKTPENPEISFEGSDIYDEKFMSALQQIIAEDEKMSLRYKEQLAEAEKNVEKNAADILAAEESERLMGIVSSAEAFIAENTPVLEELKGRIEDSSEIRMKTQAIRKQIIVEEKELEKYDILESFFSELCMLRSELDASQGRMKGMEDRIYSSKEKFREYGEKLAELKDAPVSREKLSARLFVLQRDSEDIRDIYKYINKYSELAEEYKVKRDDLSVLNAQRASLEERYLNFHGRFLGSQASLLASELKEGEPCPVCGSRNHPSPAKVEEENISKDVLDKMKADLDEISMKYQSRFAELREHSAKIEACCDEIFKRSTSYEFENVTQLSGILREKYSEYKVAIREATEKVESLEGDIRLKQRLEEVIPKVQAEISVLEERCNSEKVISADIMGKISEKEKNITVHKQSLMYDDKMQAQNSIDVLRNTLRGYENELERLQDAHDSLKEQLLMKYSDIQTNLPKIIQGDKADMGALRRMRQELLGEREMVVQFLEDVNIRLEINKDAMINLRKAYGEFARVEEEFSAYEALSATFGGRITGKDKIDLETYLQMSFFDSVLQMANTRFLVMSGGRYELRRQIEASNKASKSGLELEITDHYNNSSRSVSTLSGGESFMAALSLALGLSDAVQHRIGSVRIDAVFIDEGFGSLDSYALSQAMKVINSLSSPERPVAIISHVEDLKSMVDKRIVISKSVNGSSARVDI